MLELIRRGREAADEIVFGLFGPVEKAIDPTTARGFDRTVIGILRELKRVAAPDEKRAMAALLKGLDRDWPRMSARERTNAVNGAAAKWLGLAERAAPKAGDVLAAQGKTIVEQTKRAERRRGLRIDPSFALADETAVAASAKMQSLYIRNAYGQREDALSQVARDVVSAGLERGQDRFAIGAQLADRLAGTAAERSESYYRLIASVFAARSRTYSQLSSFEEAGIQEFEYEAVLDEVTTEICRFMHGKRFRVGLALAKYAEVASDSDPETVKELQPWAAQGKDAAGNAALTYKVGGRRQLIARVEQPGYGKANRVGSYSRAMSAERLQAAGLATPPLHGHCRSTLVPVFR